MLRSEGGRNTFFSEHITHHRTSEDLCSAVKEVETSVQAAKNNATSEDLCSAVKEVET